ncbi:DUF1902 domain-containing protein [Nitrosospira sp. Is2]
MQLGEETALWIASSNDLTWLAAEADTVDHLRVN